MRLNFIIKFPFDMGWIPRASRGAVLHSQDRATGISVEHPQIPAFSPKQIGAFIKTYE
jgi:hypothetical protein